MVSDLDPTLVRFLAVLAEIRREERVQDYRRDSILIQEGERAKRERVEAFGGQCFYERNGED